jgi:hypothetical protein
MALEAIVNLDGAYRIVLEEYPEGVYVLVYQSPDDPADSPCQDHLQDNWAIAKRAAQEDYGIRDHQWREIPDTRFNG